MKSVSSPSAATTGSASWRSRLYRAVQFPLVRLLLALITVSLALDVTRRVLELLGLAPAATSPHRLTPILIGTTATIFVVHSAYLLYVRFVERRAPTELAAAGAISELATGALIGALLFSVTIGILWAGGWYRITGTSSWTVIAIPLLSAAGTAYVEELVVRGILFRNMEDMLGSWLALAITAALFGLAHIFNPHATIVSALAIALEAGVLLGAAFMVTRRLWLAIGLHFAWNFAQGGIFGVAVSGIASNGILRGELQGPPLLSGGSFGAEGSVIAVVVCLAAAVPLIMIARHHGHVVRPMWKRPLTLTDVPQLAATAAFSRASISGAGENP